MYLVIIINGIIDKIGDNIYNSNTFMFILNSNGRCGVKKYERKRDLFTLIYNGNISEGQFYECGNDENNVDWYGISRIEDSCGIIQHIQK